MGETPDAVRACRWAGLKSGNVVAKFLWPQLQVSTVSNGLSVRAYSPDTQSRGWALVVDTEPGQNNNKRR